MVEWTKLKRRATKLRSRKQYDFKPVEHRLQNGYKGSLDRGKYKKVLVRGVGHKHYITVTKNVEIEVLLSESGKNTTSKIRSNGRNRFENCWRGVEK